MIKKLWDWFNAQSPGGASDKDEYAPEGESERPASPLEIYLLCACLHFSASVLLPILFYSIGGVGDDNSVSGSEVIRANEGFKMPAEIGFLLWHLIQALQWPVSWVLGFLSKLAGAPLFTGLIGYIPIALNSLLWGAPIYLAYREIRRRWPRKKK
jgi:hypothetical protein